MLLNHPCLVSHLFIRTLPYQSNIQGGRPCTDIGILTPHFFVCFPENLRCDRSSVNARVCRDGNGNRRLASQ